MAGLSVVGVLLENLGAEVERAGLAKDQLMQDVRVKLRQNGIKMVDLNKSLGIYLELRANCMFVEQIRSFVYSVSLFLRQPVIPYSCAGVYR